LTFSAKAKLPNRNGFQPASTLWEFLNFESPPLCFFKRFELSEAVERLEQLELAAVFRLIPRQALFILTIRLTDLVLVLF
jgi:hypothetical protein